MGMCDYVSLPFKGGGFSEAKDGGLLFILTVANATECFAFAILSHFVTAPFKRSL